ncbi:uncharacterized protein N7500_001639 [Penicillium coprophilum]|uniref:uncharacterized protein n=1 Tax=Penicillium coprophilum TaxID=36646 RepID=UPI00239BEA52|nr:uncharacterized protein N7500_001639 [Penicillium coprophilum]KAJ5173708.1 hypothetical protein N7500_001639 [Penicillium coprophilum]
MTVFKDSTACKQRDPQGKQHELGTNKAGSFRGSTGEYHASEDPYAFAGAAPLPKTAYYTVHAEIQVLPHKY